MCVYKEMLGVIYVVTITVEINFTKIICIDLLSLKFITIQLFELYFKPITTRIDVYNGGSQRRFNFDSRLQSI